MLRRWFKGVPQGVAVISGIILLTATGCSIEQFFESDWTDAGASGTPAASPTATRVRPTPMPTNTPWVYSTATPATTPAPTRTPTPLPTATPSPTPSPTPAPDYLSTLPTLDDMPDDFRLTSEDATLTAAEAAKGFNNAAQLAERLTALGYRGGAYREFALPDPGVAEFVTKMLGFQATVMRFDTVAHADEAIAFQREFAKGQADWELNDTPVDALGDATSAMKGTAEYEGTDVKVAVIFVRDGTDVYRFIAISGVYDAFDEAEDIARDALR